MVAQMLTYLSYISSAVTVALAMRSLIYRIIAHERQHRWTIALGLVIRSVSYRIVVGIIALLRGWLRHTSHR